MEQNLLNETSRKHRIRRKHLNVENIGEKRIMSKTEEQNDSSCNFRFQV